MARGTTRTPVKKESIDPPSATKPSKVTAEAASTPSKRKSSRLSTNSAAADAKSPKVTDRSPRAKETVKRTSKTTATQENKTVIEPETKNTSPRGTASNKRKRVDHGPATPAVAVKSEATDHKDIKPEAEAQDQAADPEPPATKKKRKTKEQADMPPLAARTLSPKHFLGAHVSSAGGVHNAVTNAVHIGANAFALFLKSQRKWANPPLDASAASDFTSRCGAHDFAAGRHVVPHGSYLVNLAHTDADRTRQAYESFVDDLRRCERLGIGLYNLHPGSVQGGDRGAAIAHLAANLNRAHADTAGVVTLLENMAAGGNTLGGTWEDLGRTIALVEDRSRVGVCLDTCHAFAAGYDLRTPETLGRMLEEMDAAFGLRCLRAVHLNDSKAPLGSRRDLHANIGTGFLGLRAFHAIMNEPRFEGLPIVLETPIEVYDDDGEPVKDDKGKATLEDKGIWAREIKLLESLHGMDVDGDEFKALEARLAARGAKERVRIQDQVDRKAAKAPSGKKARKKARLEDTSDIGSDSEG